MCGIMGGVELSTRAEGESRLAGWLERGLAALVHQGPDAGGHFIEGPLALGARRLRIHDLDSRADQPLFSEDGRRVVILNGAIFNYRDLRTELEALGRQFRTTCDTEVVLSAIDQWGIDALGRMSGMFALAWYDRDARRLLIARDKLGIKPLYVHRSPERVVFASEIKPLLAHPDVPRKLNRDIVPEFLAYQHVMPPDTLFEGIEVLRPGHCIEMILERDPAPREICYWRIDSSLIGNPNAPSVDEALSVSLNRVWDADRQVGIQLSGGVDSSLITAMSHDGLGKRDLQTYFVLFDDAAIRHYKPRSEERWIRQVMDQFGAQNQSYLFPAEDVRPALAQSIWHHELPLYGPSTCLYMLLAREIHDEVTVLLTGEGADDIFLGYFADWTFDESPHSLFKNFIGEPMLEQLLGSAGQEQASAKRLALAGSARLAGMSPVQKSSVVTIETVLHGLLARHDRMFMAHSIEGRPPFCTDEVIQARFARDDSEIQDGKTGKLAVKRLAERYFDDTFVYREKIGFSSPFGDWCSDDNWWRGYIDRMNDEFLGSLVDLSPLQAQRAMPEGREKWSMQNLNMVFSLAQLQLWHDIFIDAADPLSADAWQRTVPQPDTASVS